jgi:hypothetical protein
MRFLRRLDPNEIPLRYEWRKSATRGNEVRAETSRSERTPSRAAIRLF